MWSLHFLTVLVVVDVADPLNSVYVCILLSIVFASLALRDVNRDRLKSNVAETQWQKIRKLQVGEGEVEVGGLMKKVSMLRKMDIEAERREADQAAKGAGSVTNPMSPGQDDDSSSDDDETPKSLKTGAPNLAMNQNLSPLKPRLCPQVSHSGASLGSGEVLAPRASRRASAPAARESRCWPRRCAATAPCATPCWRIWASLRTMRTARIETYNVAVINDTKC